MNKLFIVIAIILGVFFIVISYVYFSTPASLLPSFFPGHTTGLMTHHYKHGVASLLLGIACLIFAWFQSGKKQKSVKEEKNG